MRILIYQPRVYYYTGGGEVYPLQTAKFFARLGHDVTILTTRAPFLQKSQYFDKFIKENPLVKVEYIDLDENFKDIYDQSAGMSLERWDRESLWVARLAYEFLMHHKYDIITTHYVIDTLAVPFGCKYVLHLHGAPSEISYLCRLVLEKQKNLLAVSKNVVKNWAKFGLSEDIKVSTNAIDDEVFLPREDKPKDIDFLFVGRLIEIKGVQYILEALKILKENYHISPNFMVIGQGPYRAELEDLARTLGVEGQVSFRGLVSNEELIDAYQRAKVGVFPSFEREGIMSTLLEAASCHLPSITTQGTSMEEFACGGKNALLVRGKDSQDLAEKMHLLLTDRALAAAIADNAKTTVEEGFTWLAKAKELIGLYQEVVDE